MNKYFIFILIVIVSFPTYLKSQSANSYLLEGLKKFEQSDYFNAIKLLSSSISIDSTIPESYFSRGLAKFRLQDYRGTISDLNKALSLKLDTDDYLYLSYLTLGLSESNIGDFKKAVYFYNSAISIYSDKSEPYFNRAQAYINLGLMSEGCTDLSKAGELGSYESYDLIKKYCVNTTLTDENVTWVKYSETILFSEYYNPNSIEAQDNIVTVQTKPILSPSSSKSDKKMLLGDSYLPEHQYWHSSITVKEINILTGESRPKSLIMFDLNRNILSETDFTKAYSYLRNNGWKKPVKGGGGESLVKVLQIRMK